jgi:tripartite-type tricarboxylate transporter receptor subunit TctC
MNRRQILLACVASAIAASSTVAPLPALAKDFRGQTVTIIVPFGVGGGNDIWGRFLAGFFSKHLPGNPAVIVRNVPGGGSVAGANLFAATAKPDGLTLLVSSGSTQFPFLLGEPRVKYDYRKLKFVLAGPTGGVAYISSKYGADLNSLSKLKGKTLHYASQGVTSLDLVPLLGFRLLGLDVKHVTGFPGRGEGRLGFERGEFDIDYQTSTAYMRSSVPLVKNGQAAPLFSWGLIDGSGKIIRDPNFPDLPSIEEAYEIVHGKKPEGIEWEAFRAFLVSGFPSQKLLLLPDGTPEEIVNVYRKAARDMQKDAEFLSKRDAIIGEYEQITDREGEILFEQATTISAEARDWVRNFLMQNYSAKF